MNEKSKTPLASPGPAVSSAQDVAEFLNQVAAVPRPRSAGKAPGRLLFAMDATASREPTWDRACTLQGQMFEETDRLGGLEIQLCFYRGFGELKRSRWLDNAAALHRAMSAVRCAGGMTQIERVLNHALGEHGQAMLNAMVFVGDVVEENPDHLCHLAGQLGIQSVPLFIFQEGDDPQSSTTFKELARLSGGAYCRFDLASATTLRDLLRAAAAFAAGGKVALERLERSPQVKHLRLTDQLP